MKKTSSVTATGQRRTQFNPSKSPADAPRRQFFLTYRRDNGYTVLQPNAPADQRCEILRLAWEWAPDRAVPPNENLAPS